MSSKRPQLSHRSAMGQIFTDPGKRMTEEEDRARWDAMSNIVADRMKDFTRPYVNILAGETPGRHTEIGSGTFVDRAGVQLLTCEHVARLNPSAYFLDDLGSLELQPGTWRTDAAANRDVAIAPMPAAEWSKASTRAQPLPMSKFAQRHAPFEYELFFFRGIAGENADYVGSFGVNAIISGYCSQEKPGTGDDQIFEILWCPNKTSITPGTSDAARARVKYDNPAGFSGSLVWNTRFVEIGCNFDRWHPEEAVVTGFLRRFDKNTNTLLVWRVEQLHRWL